MSNIWQQLAALVRPKPKLPQGCHKMFQHIGERTTVTDSAAEAIAVHTLLEAYPNATDIKLEWIHHNQPDYWLLFVTGKES